MDADYPIKMYNELKELMVGIDDETPKPLRVALGVESLFLSGVSIFREFCAISNPQDAHVKSTFRLLRSINQLLYSILENDYDNDYVERLTAKVNMYDKVLNDLTKPSLLNSQPDTKILEKPCSIKFEFDEDGVEYTIIYTHFTAHNHYGNQTEIERNLLRLRTAYLTHDVLGLFLENKNVISRLMERRALIVKLTEHKDLLELRDEAKRELTAYFTELGEKEDLLQYRIILASAS